MRQLRIGTWGLSAMLVAVIARAIISGLTFATEVTGALIALTLLATLLLARRGRQLEPPEPAALDPTTTNARPSRRA